MCAPYTPLVFRQLVLSQFGQRDVCGGGEERRQEMTAAPLTSPLRPEERGDRGSARRLTAPLRHQQLAADLRRI